jgi:hypothetical protein
MHSVAQWNRLEINLVSTRAYANPYAEVDLTITFKGPGCQTITRPAFWNGNNGWKVRFAPITVGTWTWQSICSETTDAGLHNKNGQFECIPYTGPNPLYRHGFLRISGNRRHFIHADGTPFFWLGDTHWQMPDTERVAECNHPEHAGAPCPHGGQMQHLAADRKAKGFTVYQTYPLASNPHWWTAPFDRINPERFNRVFDVQMDHLADQGFVTAMGCGHFMNWPAIPTTDLCRFARYLVARYGAHPIVWITCQELNAPAETGEAERMEAWIEVAREIHRQDGYGHPHSAHQWVVDVQTRPIAQEPWHTWFALQGGHRGSGLTPQARYKGYYDYQPTRPMIETEAMYELIDCGGVGSTNDARISAWKGLLCGSPGYTYGAGGVWALKWNPADPQWKAYNYPVEAWYAGMALPGSYQMAVLGQFFSKLDWTSLTPRFLDTAWSEWTAPERCAVSTIGTSDVIAYCYGDSSKGTLKQLDPSKRYVARWFDPRAGHFIPISTCLPAPDGTWPVPEKPDASDWVLLVLST